MLPVKKQMASERTQKPPANREKPSPATKIGIWAVPVKARAELE